MASTNDEASQEIAQRFDVRCIPFQNLYDTLADVVIIADASMEIGTKKSDFNPSFMRATMTVLDVTTMPEDSPIIQEARQRGCRVVEPAEVLADQMQAQFKSVTSKDVPAETFRAAFAGSSGV